MKPKIGFCHRSDENEVIRVETRQIGKRQDVAVAEIDNQGLSTRAYPDPGALVSKVDEVGISARAGQRLEFRDAVEVRSADIDSIRTGNVEIGDDVSIVALAEDEGIVTGAASEGIVTRATIEDIVFPVAENKVVTPSPDHILDRYQFFSGIRAVC